MQGSVFFPLPDGHGLMYHVSGTAEPPKPNGKLARDVPCKLSFVETLAVHNWLRKSQRWAFHLVAAQTGRGRRDICSPTFWSGG